MSLINKDKIHTFLIDKILKESEEDNNLFQPRRIEDREKKERERMKKMVKKYKEKLSRIWLVKIDISTRSKHVNYVYRLINARNKEIALRHPKLEDEKVVSCIPLLDDYERTVKFLDKLETIGHSLPYLNKFFKGELTYYHSI